MCGATILKSCVPQYLQHKKLVTCTKIALCFYNHYEKDEIICHVYLYSVKKAFFLPSPHTLLGRTHVKDSIPFVGVLKRLLFGERTEGRSLRKVVALYANLLISAFLKCQPCSVLEESGSLSLSGRIRRSLRSHSSSFVYNDLCAISFSVLHQTGLQ